MIPVIVLCFYIDGKKYGVENPNDIQKWLNCESLIYCLNNEEIASEAEIMGLRSVNGVDKKYFDLIAPVVKNFLQTGVLVETKSRLAISSKYMDLCDYIIKEVC